MSEDLLALSEAILSGEKSVSDNHPFTIAGEVTEIIDGVAFVSGFSNAIVFVTDAGLVMVDSGGFMNPSYVHEKIRSWSDAPLHTVVFSHGHVDHVFGVGPFDSEAEQAGRNRPVVIAHENVPPRFDRYVLTAGYNSVINQRQFRAPELKWPTEYRYPDVTYRDRHEFEVGGIAFELSHAKGETDDHTWTWVPDKKVLCCGDLFIWCSPNAGNPQKVQRYPREWAQALRTMEALGAEVLLPGHGLPIVGTEHVQQVLSNTAAYLESIVEQTLALMNEGRPLDEIVRSVRVPEELATKPYLQPIYDEPDFIVHNIWRLYGGWYEGDSVALKPPAPDRLGGAIADLAGGADRVADAAKSALGEGDLALARALIDLAAGATDDAAIYELRAAIYERSAAEATSTMTKGIFSWAASKSKDLGPDR